MSLFCIVHAINITSTNITRIRNVFSLKNQTLSLSVRIEI